MNYRDFNLGDWIGHISGVIEDETTLDGNEMRDLVEFLTTLKQYPTTKNDLGVDCISRKAALDITWHDPSYSDPLNVLTEVRDKIKALPSATPIRPKGHWCPQNDDYFDWYECSECGYGSEGEMQYSSEVDVRTNYCPYCGCRME